MLPFAEDQELARHLAGLQPTTTKPKPARKTKPAGVHLGSMAANFGGFAFVKPDAPIDGLDRDSDLFCHRTEVQAGLAKGDRVSFELHRSQRKQQGFEARNVRAA
jgi:cold shock CspA family protein